MAKLDASTARSDRWAPVLEKLLIGVTHNISNRVATLAGVSDILSGDPTIPPVLRALSDEVPRLEEAIRLLRLLAAPGEEGEEALEATRVTDDAISLAQLHPACRNVTFRIEGRAEVPPVIARPTELTHALVIVLTAASGTASVPDKSGPGDGRSSTPVTDIPIRFVTHENDLVISAGSSSVRARLLSAGRQ